MTILKINNLYKSYGANEVLCSIYLQVYKGEKIGLVGLNGTGKTTLLKIIIGEEEADQGHLFFAKGLTTSYLSQKPDFFAEESLKNYMQRSMNEIYQLREKLFELEKEMALPEVKRNARRIQQLMEKYGQLSNIFEEKGGYTLESRVKSIIRGLGFREEDLKRPLTDFSGGQKTRIQLASLLLKEPDLLLLDEPTNNLDIDAVEWLEKYLSSWPNGLIVVSHDRYFLDRVVKNIFLLENRALKRYKGNYSAFLQQRHIEEKTREKAYKKQQVELAREQELIRSSKADERSKRQARSREKRVAKMEIVETTEEHSLKADFGFIGRSGDLVVSFENVSKHYKTLKVFSGATFKIYWGNRVAIVGPNGAGKSTLLKMITGEEIQTSGQISVGPSVRVAYFDQEQEMLEQHMTPLENIMNISSMKKGEARNYLAHYLFRGEEVFKRVADLSGGEKSRLALAKTALADSNFLIMDEPTNHLDIKGVEELESALANYPGTLLVVSHDRYFISRIANRIIEVNNGEVRYFKGNYRDYGALKARGKDEIETCSLEKKNRQAQREKEKQRREKLLELRRVKRELNCKLMHLEEKIEEEEQKVAEYEKWLAEPKVYENFAEAKKMTEDFKAAKNKIKQLLEEWEGVGLEIERLPDED